MKRRSFDRSDWTRVTASRFHVTYLETPEYTGYITLFAMDEVATPFYAQTAGEPTVLADSGFSWLQHFPRGARHTVTTMFDAMGKVVQWYIDICGGHGVDERGVPWFDDLYLDIVVTPAGQVALLDADELDQALRDGRISRRDHEAAWTEARLLMDMIVRGAMPLLALSIAHRRLFQCGDLP